MDNNIDKDEKLVAELFGIIEKKEIDNSKNNNVDSNNNNDCSEFDNIISYEEYIEYERKKAKAKEEPPPAEAGGLVEAGTFTKAAEQPAKVISDNNNIQPKKQKFKFFDYYNDKYGYVRKKPNSKKLLFNFILQPGITFLVGAGGMGKTYLCYHLIIDLLKDKSNRIAYLDFDNPVGIPEDRAFSEKVSNLQKEHSIKYYDRDDFLLAYSEYKELKTIQSFIFAIIDEAVEYKKEHQDENVIIFIDALQSIIHDFSIEKNSSDFMYYLRNNADLGLTFVVLHHVAKGSGIYKGFTVLKDAADMMYTIKSVKRDIDKNITDYTLQVEKARYKAPESINIAIHDDFELEIEESDIKVVDKVILKLAYNALKNGTELIKKDLTKHILNHLENKNVGRIKIERIISEYSEQGFFKTRQGDKRAIYYSLDFNNELVKNLFNDWFYSTTTANYILF